MVPILMIEHWRDLSKIVIIKALILKNSTFVNGEMVSDSLYPSIPESLRGDKSDERFGRLSNLDR
jgi:hypothetical protein